VCFCFEGLLCFVFLWTFYVRVGLPSSSVRLCSSPGLAVQVLESYAYFSLSLSMTIYLSQEFDFSDTTAGIIYGMARDWCSVLLCSVECVIVHRTQNRHSRAHTRTHCATLPRPHTTTTPRCVRILDIILRPDIWRGYRLPRCQVEPYVGSPLVGGCTRCVCAHYRQVACRRRGSVLDAPWYAQCTRARCGTVHFVYVTDTSHLHLPPAAALHPSGMSFGIPVLVISIKRSTNRRNRSFAFSLFCTCTCPHEWIHSCVACPRDSFVSIHLSVTRDPCCCQMRA